MQKQNGVIFAQVYVPIDQITLWVRKDSLGLDTKSLKIGCNLAEISKNQYFSVLQ
jgi:hypothetical protein